MTNLPFPLKDQTTRTIRASFLDVYSYNTIDKASTFESSTSFSSTALQPQPRNSINSGPLNGFSVSSVNLSSEDSLFDEDGECLNGNKSQNLQWAQGKAGEDIVHVVVSEENGWVFVGVYDGFNGPDAPDFLLSNLYAAVHKELKGLLWDDDQVDSSDSVKQSLDDADSLIDNGMKKNRLSRYVHQ
ncbi:putative protein-serine/threonine phosphatase [Helianthus debilis subsp. tardiflorus]